MTWPTGAVDLTHMDAGTDDPNTARADLLDTATKLNLIIAHGDPALLPGRLLGVRLFTSNGTYTPTAGTSKVIVELVGGGGGSGSAGSVPFGQFGGGSGGGGGWYMKVLLTSGFSGAAVVVGAGGAAPGFSGGIGNQGGTTSFINSSTLAVPGGSGGRQLSAIPTSTSFAFCPGSYSSGSFVQTVGTLLQKSAGGNSAPLLYAAGPVIQLGVAGHSFLGSPQSTLGALGWGSGGSSSSLYSPAGGGTQFGEDGTAGVVRIWEFS